MKKIKRIIRILIFVCLIFLAALGVGISGGVPIPMSKNRRDKENEDIELLETQDEKSGAHQSQFKT